MRRVPVATERTCGHTRPLGSDRDAMDGPDLTALFAGRRNAGMTNIRYAVGSTVYIWRRPSPSSAIAGAYRVVAHYPSESSGRLYRVRAVVGLEERMVPEADLSEVPRSADAVERTPRKQRSA